MKRPRVRYEIRAMAGADLYQRLLREAAARGWTVSECVRRELEELYAFRDQLGDALRIAGDDGAPARGLFEAALQGLEARLAGNFGAQLERLDRVASDVARLEAMLDRFYLALMVHLDDVPDHARAARLKRASERHRAWLEVVERMISAAPRVPASDVSSTPPDTAAAGPTAADARRTRP